jgi:non-ribosomal peptide synthetase component E (peptide arylation enzyme)
VQSGVRDRKTLKSAAGTLISNSELRFLDSEDKDVGANTPGEIICRGPNVMMYVQPRAWHGGKLVLT